MRPPPCAAAPPAAERLFALAGRARKALEPAAGAEIRAFLIQTFTPDGAGTDRHGRPDLYYTFFALEALAALGQPPPATSAGWVGAQRPADQADLPHLVALAGARRRLGLDGAGTAPAWTPRLSAFRTPSGAYALRPGGTPGPYATFLAALAHDLARPAPGPAPVLSAGERAALADPGHLAGMPSPALAAALCLLAWHGHRPPPAARRALRGRLHPPSGVRAGPRAPLGDLLSTATAVTAFAAAADEEALRELRQPCRSLVARLWEDTGGFLGHLADDAADAEYTFYALLTLGALA